jgi:hypothetical protein
MAGLNFFPLELHVSLYPQLPTTPFTQHIITLWLMQPPKTQGFELKQQFASIESNSNK